MIILRLCLPNMWLPLSNLEFLDNSKTCFLEDNFVIRTYVENMKGSISLWKWLNLGKPSNKTKKVKIGKSSKQGGGSTRWPGIPNLSTGKIFFNWKVSQTPRKAIKNVYWKCWPVKVPKRFGTFPKFHRFFLLKASLRLLFWYVLRIWVPFKYPPLINLMIVWWTCIMATQK